MVRQRGTRRDRSRHGNTESEKDIRGKERDKERKGDD